jgi:hypothetical protein
MKGPKGMTRQRCLQLYRFTNWYQSSSSVNHRIHCREIVIYTLPCLQIPPFHTESIYPHHGVFAHQCHQLPCIHSTHLCFHCLRRPQETEGAFLSSQSASLPNHREYTRRPERVALDHLQGYFFFFKFNILVRNY